MKLEFNSCADYVAQPRSAFWEARFAVAVANCNASMIRAALSISLIEPS